MYCFIDTIIAWKHKGVIMKRTLANIKKLIEAKIIQYRKLQDEQQSAGNYERAEKYKIRRWELEELLEDLESWVFIEWSICNSKPYIEGVNFPSNMLFAYMLIFTHKFAFYPNSIIYEKLSVKR